MGWFGRRCSNIRGSPLYAQAVGWQQLRYPSPLTSHSPSFFNSTRLRTTSSTWVEVTRWTSTTPTSRRIEAAKWPVKCEHFDVQIAIFYRWYKSFPNGLFIVVLSTLHILGVFFLDGNPDYCSLIEGVQWCSVGEFHHTRADFELNQDIINLAVRLKPQLWFTLVGHLFIFLAFFGNVQSILQRLMLLAQCLTAFGIPPALWLLPGGGSVAWWGWGGWLDVAGWLWVANWC